MVAARPPSPMGHPPAGRCRLRPAAADPTWSGRGRHEDVPVPGSGTPALTSGTDVGPEHRHGDGDAPEHRIPVAHGSVLLADGRHRPPGLGRPTSVVGLDHPAGRARCALDAPGAPMGRRGGHRGVLRLCAQPVPARVRGAHLGHPPSVRRAPVADRPGRSRTATQGLGHPGGVRARHADRRRCQRHVAHPRHVRSAAVVPARDLRRPRGHLRPGTRDGAADHGPDRRDLAVVGRRVDDPGGLRHPDPALHRDLRDRRGGSTRSRGPPGARLLVLLRHRRTGRVDRVDGPLRRVGPVDRALVPRPRAGTGGRVADPVAAPGVLRVDHRGRPRALGRCPSMGEPVAVRTGLPGLGARRPGPVVPFDPPGRAAGDPGARGVPRRRGRRAVEVAAAPAPPRHRDAARADLRQPAAVVPGTARRSQPGAGRGRAGVLDRGGRRAGRG